MFWLDLHWRDNNIIWYASCDIKRKNNTKISGYSVIYSLPKSGSASYLSCFGLLGLGVQTGGLMKHIESVSERPHHLIQNVRTLPSGIMLAWY